jgi:hypothetical protein
MSILKKQKVKWFVSLQALMVKFTTLNLLVPQKGFTLALITMVLDQYLMAIMDLTMVTKLLEPLSELTKKTVS